MSDRALTRIGTIVLGILVMTTPACSGESDRLPEELVESTTVLVVDRALGAGVELADDGAECVARRLEAADAETLQTVADGDVDLPAELADRLAESVLVCVDSTSLARTALEPLAGGAGPDSLDCAADRLGDGLIATLISASLQGTDLPAAQVESEVAIAFGLCFTPAELLNRG